MTAWWIAEKPLLSIALVSRSSDSLASVSNVVVSLLKTAIMSAVLEERGRRRTKAGKKQPVSLTVQAASLNDGSAHFSGSARKHVDPSRPQ